MKRLCMKNIFVLLFLPLILLFAVSSVNAVEGISPNADRVIISAGETKTKEIKFMLLREKPETVSFKLMHVAFGPQGNILIAERLEDLKIKSNSGVRFVQKIGPVSSEAKGKWESVNLTVSVPRDTLPGDYPVGIVVEPIKLMSLIVIEVRGNKNPGFEGIIKEAKAEIREGRVFLSAEFENTGRKTFLPVVACVVKKDGKDFGVMELEVTNEMYDFILPFNSRHFGAFMQRVLPVGNYEFEFFWGFGGERVGKPVIKKLSIDNDFYLKHKSLYTIDVNVSSIILMLPNSTFFEGELLVKNLTSNKITVTLMPLDSWLRVSHPRIDLEAEGVAVVRYSIQTPLAFAERMTSKIMLIHDVGSFQVNIRVLPIFSKKS
ncbi:MAG: hypothetical protein QXR60_02355 [Candidatus Nanoarchaeia archaeon]